MLSEGEGKGCTFLFKIPMQRRLSNAPLPMRLSNAPLPMRTLRSAMNQMASLVRSRANSQRRPDSLVEVSQHSCISHRSLGNDLKRDQSTKSTRRKVDAQRLAEQREQLARRLSVASLNSSSHSALSPMQRDDTAILSARYSSKKQRSDINLLQINNTFRTNKSNSIREANLDAFSSKADDQDVPNVANAGIVPSPVVIDKATTVPSKPLIAPYHEVSVNEDANPGGSHVGGGPGPAVVTNDVKHSGGVVSERCDVSVTVKEENIRPTSSLRQSSKSPSGHAQANKQSSCTEKSNRTISSLRQSSKSPTMYSKMPSGKEQSINTEKSNGTTALLRQSGKSPSDNAQLNRMPSNRAITINSSDEREKTASPTNSMVVQVSPMVRKGSVKANEYKGSMSIIP